MPEGLTIISDQAFWYCNHIVEISLPEELTMIGSDALESINVSKDNNHFSSSMVCFMAKRKQL